MTQTPAISVIIVSRDRPLSLARTLLSLRFQTFQEFEVIVVAPYKGNDDDVTWVSYDEENIAAARNLGIQHARGEILAFLDDDAIPEPSWLTELHRCFENNHVGAAGGFVRKRDGIAHQWRGLETDSLGIDHKIEISALMSAGMHEGRHLKIQGTNMAYRRKAVEKIGGLFDEAFKFYFEETDLTRRLAQDGWKIAVNPHAEVLHLDAPSKHRSSVRIPRSMAQLGSSWRHFIEKHHRSGDTDRDTQQILHLQKRRLEDLYAYGWLEAREIRNLFEEFSANLCKDPSASIVPKLTKKAREGSRFKTFQKTPITLSGSIWSARKLRAEASRLAQLRHPVFVIILSRTAIPHRRRFVKDGYWLQTGGVFGRSSDQSNYFQWVRLKKRAKLEYERVSKEANFGWSDS